MKLPPLIPPSLTADGFRSLAEVVRAHPLPWNHTQASIIDAAGKTVVLMEGGEPARGLLLRIMIDTINLTFHVCERSER